MGKKGKISKRKLNKVPEGFRKASDVVDIQNNFLKAISGQTHTSNFKKEELGTIQEAIVNKEIERLRVLAKKFQNQEEVLFQKFSSKGITNYKKLNEKIQEWNESLGGNFLFENSFINKVVQIMKDEQNDDLEALVDQFINKKLDINVILEVMGIEKIEDGLVDVIFSGLKGGVAGKRKGTLTTGFKVDSNSSAGKGLSKLVAQGDYFHSSGITIYQKKTPNKKSNNSFSEFEIRFTTDVSGKTKSKIIKDFTDIINQQNDSKDKQVFSHRQESVEKISDLILARIPKVNSETRTLVEKVLKENLIEEQNYDLNKSTSVIKGTLGEIYWTCFFSYIGLKVKPTGLNLKDIYNRQVPTDLVFENIGFQVKQYSEFNNSVYFGLSYGALKKDGILEPEKVSLQNLFATKLQFGDGKANDMVGKFFFSKNYNLRNEKYDKKGEYTSIYNRFAPIEASIKTYVEANIDKLIGTNSDIQLADNSAFIEVDVGRPTIWFINDKLIPSSVIVEKIIENLKKSLTGESSVFISLEKFSLDTQSFHTKETWPEKAEPNLKNRMQSAKGEYLISVDLKAFFSKLQKELNFF